MIDPTARFVVLPLGRDDPLPENAIAHGSWNALGPLLFDTAPLIAALDLAARTVAHAEQMQQSRQAGEQQLVADGVTALIDGLAQLRSRVDALARSQSDRHKLDAASEVARELLEIPQDKPPPVGEVGAAVRDQSPAPAGELHSLPPSHPEDKEQLAASEREDQGNLPNELVAKAPPAPGTHPVLPGELGKAPDPPAQPVAISLW